MPRKADARKTSFGAELIEGMKTVLAHQRGKVELEQGVAAADRCQGDSQAGENVPS